MIFILRLKRRDATIVPRQREIDRPTTAEAVDAAARWLRLRRNVGGMAELLPDAWEVAIPNEEHGARVIAAGDLSVFPHSQA